MFELTLAASDAVTRATSRVNDIENPSGTRGAWAEEVGFGVNRSRSTDSAGYQGGGFGFVGGLETGGGGSGRLWPHRLFPDRRHQGPPFAGG